MHEGVGAALEGLIEGGGAGGDQGDAEEGDEGGAVEGGDAGAEVAEVQAGGGGDEDHEGDAELEESGVGGEEGGVLGEGVREGGGCGVGHVFSLRDGVGVEGRAGGGKPELLAWEEKDLNLEQGLGTRD